MTLLEEISQYLKHEKIKVKEESSPQETVEFYIPENLDKKEVDILLALKDCFEKALEDTEISYVETSALEFQKRIQKTYLQQL